jgi:hypothetical protein
MILTNYYTDWHYTGIPYQVQKSLFFQFTFILN